MSSLTFNLLGVNDVPRVRAGGNTARIIRQTSCEAGPIATRVVMTETRNTTDTVDMPVCWAVITRVYTQDADGWEMLEETESLWTDSLELEYAWDNAKEDAVSAMRSAYEWFVFDDEKQEVAK